MADKNVHVALTFDYDAYSGWIAAGAKSPSMVSRGEFGPIGLRRILQVLESNRIKSTFFVPGHTALAFPRTVTDIAAAGHEIGHHGWVHENPATASGKDQERVWMERGLEALDRVAGIRPTGYRSPAWDNSPDTVSLLLEYGFRYESSLMGNEYDAYWCRVGDVWTKQDPWVFGTPVDLVELPVSWMLDDFPHFEIVPNANPGLKNPREVLEMWIDEFDYLYDRIGQGIFNLTMHPQTIGRGARIIVLEKLIDHIKGRPGVTFGTLSEYAEKWRVGRTPSLPTDAA